MFGKYRLHIHSFERNYDTSVINTRDHEKLYVRIYYKNERQDLLKTDVKFNKKKRLQDKNILF